MARPNGWQAGNKERHRTSSDRARRAARRRALEKGHADPIFAPFSKKLAPDLAGSRRAVRERAEGADLGIAYAMTACDEVRFGESPALKQLRSRVKLAPTMNILLNGSG
jgi:hypothetical protein